MTPLLSRLSLKVKSSLKPLLNIQHWLILLGVSFPYLHPLTTLCLILRFFLMTFSIPLSALTLGGIMVLMESLLLFSVAVLQCSHPTWSNFSVSVYYHPPFLLCWKLPYIQPVPKKSDRSNLSNKRLIALTSCLSKAFEFILNRKIVKYISAHSRLSDRQYELSKERTTGDLLAFLIEFWSSSLWGFGETFAVILDIIKPFDRDWNISLIYKLPSFGFYPSLCTIISSFLSGRSIAAVVDGHCSYPKLVTSVV